MRKLYFNSIWVRYSIKYTSIHFFNWVIKIAKFRVAQASHGFCCNAIDTTTSPQAKRGTLSRIQNSPEIPTWGIESHRIHPGYPTSLRGYAEAIPTQHLRLIITVHFNAPLYLCRLRIVYLRSNPPRVNELGDDVLWLLQCIAAKTLITPVAPS